MIFDVSVYHTSNFVNMFQKNFLLPQGSILSAAAMAFPLERKSAAFQFDCHVLCPLFGGLIHHHRDPVDGIVIVLTELDQVEHQGWTDQGCAATGFLQRQLHSGAIVAFQCLLYRLTGFICDLNYASPLSGLSKYS